MLVFLYLLAAACIVYAFVAFQGKGPLLATLYAVATKEERIKIKTLPFYRFVASVFFTVGIMLLLAGLALQYAIQFLFSVVIVMGILLAVYVVAVAIYSEMKKG